MAQTKHFETSILSNHETVNQGTGNSQIDLELSRVGIFEGKKTKEPEVKS